MSNCKAFRTVYRARVKPGAVNNIVETSREDLSCQFFAGGKGIRFISVIMATGDSLDSKRRLPFLRENISHLFSTELIESTVTMRK